MDLSPEISQEPNSQPQNSHVVDSAATITEEGGLIAEQLEEFDLAEVGKPLIDPQTGKYHCQICVKNRTFSNADSFRAHRNRHHGTIRNTIICPVDPVCPKMASVFTFRAHLAKEHNFQSVAQRFAFATKVDFLQWKEQIEKETVAFFVRLQAARKSGHEIWHCNRSRRYRSHRSAEEQLRREQLGKPEKSGKRKDGQDRAGRQSSKMGAQCPAMICVRYHAKFIEVEAYLDHLGHEHDVRFLPISTTARERTRALLQEGNRPEQVLQIVKREAVPGDRTHRLNVKAVSCIQLRDQERINRAHLEANYLIVQPELVVETKPAKEWLVQSAKDGQQFSVKRTYFGCPNEECHMHCDNCHVCPHLYSCSCPRKVKLPCKHIHGVHVLHGHRSYDEPAVQYEDDDTVEVDHSDQRVADYDAGEGSSADHDINVVSSSPVPEKMPATVKKVADQSKRLVDKLAKLTAMWEALPYDALGEASELADRLEDVLNEGLAKALTVLPPQAVVVGPRTTVNVPKVDVTSYFSPSPPKKKRGRPSKKENTKKQDIPELFTNKQGILGNYSCFPRRLPVIFDHTKFSLAQLGSAPVDSDSRPPTLTATVATASSREASRSDIVKQSKFSFAKAGSSSRTDTPLQTASATVFTTSVPSSGKVIVLKYLKRKGPAVLGGAASDLQYSTTPTPPFPNKALVLQYSKAPATRLSTTASGLQLRQIRPVIRCIACYRVIGSNHLTAKKCTKCDQWCHHICAHLCVD